METIFTQAFGQMLSGATEPWLVVAYVGGVFFLFAQRQNSFEDAWSWRRSCFFFAAYLIMAPAINLIDYFMTMDESGRFRSVMDNMANKTANRDSMLVLYIGALLSRIFYAVSIAYAMRALLVAPRKPVEPSGDN